MSDTRLQSITTQQLALQNPDGSFPPLGVVLAVTDSVGTIAPVTDISVNSLTADHVNITGSIIQNQLISQSITSEDITLTSFSGNTLSLYDVSASRLSTTHLDATDANANYTATPSLTADTAYVTRTIAGTANITTVGAGSLRATTLTSGNAIFTDLSATTVTASNLTTTRLIAATDVSSSTATVDTVTSDSFVATSLRTGDISGNTVTAQNATVTSSLSTKNVTVQGAFTFNQINLQNLTTSKIIANDVSTNVLTVTGAATLRDVSATTLNIRNLTETGSYTAANVRANTFTPTTLTLPNTLKPTALTVTGVANMADVSANTIISANPTMTNMTGAKNRTTNAFISSGLNIGGGGALRYTSELLMNDVSASSMYILRPTVPFGAAYVDNGLATVADIRTSLSSTVSIFNNFMDKFNSRGIVVDLSPKLVFNSTMSMQFQINGVIKTPVVFAAGAHSLKEIIGALNAVCTPGILFSVRNTSGALWETTITVSPTGTYYIADYTNTPTASLQLLRWLGFSINDRDNPFEIYNASNICVPQLLSGSYISSVFSIVPLTYPSITQNIPQFSYVFNYENNGKYRITINLPTYSGINYQLISFNNSQTLYNSGQGSIDINNLLPATLYPYTMYYLDNYNISLSASTMLAVPVLPAPGVAAVPAPTFSSISISLSTNSGYNKYEIDAVGPNIPSRTIVTGSTYTFNNLFQNQPYSITAYLLDSSNNIISLPGTITITTPTLTPPNLFLNQIRTFYSENFTEFTVTSNTLYNLRWNTYISGTTGTLNYRINSGSTITHPLQIGDISYNIPSPLTGTGDISAALMFTDTRNTVYGVRVFPYSSTFGLYNLTDSGSNLTLNGTTTRLGYSLMTVFPAGQAVFPVLSLGGPWVGYTFSRVNFPQAITVLSAPVRIVARVYDLSYTVYADPNITSQNIIMSNISIPVASSNFTLFRSSTLSSSLSPGVYNNISLTFTPSITLTANMVVMFEIASGTGSVQFTTYTSTDETVTGYTTGINYLHAIATGLSYDGTNLTNTYATRNHNGVSCQFVY